MLPIWHGRRHRQNPAFLGWQYVTIELTHYPKTVGPICARIAQNTPRDSRGRMQALDNAELGFEAGRLFDRDVTLVADLIHRLRDQLADSAILIGRNRTDLGYLVVG